MGFGPPRATQTSILADLQLRPDLRLQMARLPVCMADAGSSTELLCKNLGGFWVEAVVRVVPEG